MRIRTLLAVATVGLAATAAAARAQTGSQSDVTGVSTTGSSIAGGAFTPTEAGTVSVPTTATSAAAVTTATATVATTISTGSLTTVTGAPISQAVQAEVSAVMTSNSPTTGPAGQVATTLTAAGAPAAVVAALVESISGLISNPSPGQLAAAVNNYNSVVQTANAAFLQNPPAAFLAIQAVLAQISSAASIGAK